MSTPPLWKHQRDGIAFLRDHPASMLAYDMGTGKTRVAIEAMSLDGAQRVLVLCPKSVVAVWPRELEKYAPGRYLAVPLGKGTTAERAARAKQALFHGAARGDKVVVIVNYEAAWRGDLKKLLLGVDWDLVIADESHRIKAPGGKASAFCALLSSRARKRLCMTGTPMPHSPLDIYGQYRFLAPSIFGTSFARFKAEYAKMGGYGGHEVDEYINLERLQAMFYSIALRVEADEVLDLPGLHEYDRVVELEPGARRAYDQLLARFQADLAEGRVTAANVLTRLLRLSQCANGVLKTDDGQEVAVSQAKEQALEEVFDELERSEPVVVFCRFRTDIDTVHRVAAAAGRVSKELSGRCNELQEWQEGHGSILAVQIQAGGVGVDLTRARYAVYYSVNYSMGDYDQSRRRLYRPGQSRRCTYVHLVAEATIDQDIYEALSERRDLVESVLIKNRRAA